MWPTGVAVFYRIDPYLDNTLTLFLTLIELGGPRTQHGLHQRR